MPIEIKNPNEMDLLAHRIQIVEAQLAKGIYTAFNSGVALSKLQAIAKEILKQMENGPDAAFHAANAEERFLRVWKKIERHKTSFHAFQFSHNLIKLDATDCADLIRVAGAWVESGGLKHAPASVKDAFRGGKNPGPGSSGLDVWNQKGEAGPRIRVRGDGRAVEPHLQPYQRDPTAFSGMKRKRACAESTLLKLDRLFGLVVACDISGTTADTVFALEVFGAQQGLHAAYYMLPLGTIVHNMHHSILEVALPITLNREMKYHIGFPDTLVPTHANGYPPELQSIANVLTNANSRMLSLHHMCYFVGGVKTGCFMFESNELMRLKNLSEATKMHTWALGGGHPTRNEVVRLLIDGGIQV